MSMLELDLSSDEEEYQINAFEDDWDARDDEDESGNSAGVPLLEVRSTGSFRSLPHIPPDDESFLQYKPDTKCKIIPSWASVR